MGSGWGATGPRVARRSRSRTWALVAPVVVLLAGCGSGPEAAAPSIESGSERPSSSATGSPSPAASSPRPSAKRGPAALPEENVTVTGLSLPSIDVAATRLERLSLDDDGVLRAPKDADLAGWYADGVVPGELGPAVIAGHVDSQTGPAVFARLGQLRAGDAIAVRVSADGATKTVRFRVDKTIVVSQADFPSAEVYGPSPDAQLRLITCGGPYDRAGGGYQDNVVVFATLEAQEPRVR